MLVPYSPDQGDRPEGMSGAPPHSPRPCANPGCGARQACTKPLALSLALKAFELPVASLSARGNGNKSVFRRHVDCEGHH